jgi:SIR2-like domain
MQRIVYVLGAGFSQPLKLPVMSDFIEKARDLYDINRNEYKHFSKVLNRIQDKLSFVKNFYVADLYNIEEVLSILVMDHLLGQTEQDLLADYTKFIIDVIKHYTPKIYPTPTGLINVAGFPGNPEYSVSLFSMFQDNIQNNIDPNILRSYAGFTLGLFNATLKPNDNNQGLSHLPVHCQINSDPKAEYSIITLNYDLVLENFAQFINDNSIEPKLKFARASSYDGRQVSPLIAKLHGSVDDGYIIPPTWNKAMNPEIEKEWKLAYNLLASANHVRFIGYSLPVTDAYVRYLFKSSLLNADNPNLKTIDVLCKDDKNHTVEHIYNNFIDLPTNKYRFRNADTYDYLSSIMNSVESLQSIEVAHDSFFSSHIPTIGPTI